MSDNVKYKVGVIEVCRSILTLVAMGGIPWAYATGVSLAEISVIVQEIKSDVDQHSDLDRHKGAVSISEFDEANKQVKIISDGFIEQRVHLQQIQETLQNIDRAVSP